MNLFHVTGLSLYPLKITENLWCFDVFREYGKRVWKSAASDTLHY